MSGTPDWIIDILEGLNVLPNETVGGINDLALVPGTWQDLSASN
jgi:hypothetical protein